MRLLVLPWLFRNGFVAMALYPFVILRDKKSKEDRLLINHEKIHLKQQAELLIIGFYIWYLTEFLINLIKYRNGFLAYYNISFEQEAFKNECYDDYLEKRKHFSFLYYLNK